MRNALLVSAFETGNKAVCIYGDNHTGPRFAGDYPRNAYYCSR